MTIAGHVVTIGPLLLVLDLLGVVAFALSGALLGVRRRLDLFGVLVLAGVTGLGGGVIRDVVSGAVPPRALADWRYLVTVVVAGLACFVGSSVIGRMERPVAVWDAAGMALFCVTGATAASERGLPIVSAGLLGMITAIGGGVLRDLLAVRVPTVLRREIYAFPALVGGLLAAVVHQQGWSEAWLVVAAVFAFAWRFLAIRLGWNAPMPRGVSRDDDTGGEQAHQRS